MVLMRLPQQRCELLPDRKPVRALRWSCFFFDPRGPNCHHCLKRNDCCWFCCVLFLVFGRLVVVFVTESLLTPDLEQVRV